MADIFLSYASEDRARIAPLAKALANAGFTLWWDRDIRPGRDFSETIEREIRAARVVVLAWSGASVRSQWVRDEAAFARDANKLIPLRIDTADAPMGFRQIQAIDFGDWRNDPLSPAFTALVASVHELLVRESGLPVPIATKPSWRARARSFALRHRTPLLAGSALVAAVLATWAFMNSSYAPGARVVALGEVEVEPFIASPPDPARAALAATYAAAFRQRLTELGIRNSAGSAVQETGNSELILVGELNNEGGKNVLTAHIDDRRSRATLWSVGNVPSEGAAWESNLAGFALKCALKRRDPQLGTEVFSRYIYGCAHFLERDFGAFYAVAKELYEAAPTNPNALGFCAVANVGTGWGEARSKAEHDRLIGEGVRLAGLALKIDPHNADAMFAMGFAQDDSQFGEQEKWWRRAIEADPELGWGLGRYANLLTAVGRVREAIDIGLRAQQQRRVPDVPVGSLLAAAGDLQEAKVQYDLVRPMDPEYVDGEELGNEVRYGDADAALKKLREHPALAGDSFGCWTQMLAARRKEPPNPARFAKDCGGGGEPSVRAFALAGDLDAAYREMELYFRSEHRFAPHLFWPEMRGFIRDPRFWPVAARLGLVKYWLDTDQWPDFCSEADLPFVCKVEAAKVRGASNPSKEGGK